ncbi:hypothetical protein AMS68_000208 [Peltaster fructicola]|uniref:DUF7962 domain-containing protein n=1 Tax=Peltaster fructicola TaxID=286661 RepID=A0A6H0XJ77_9PEZI|nr:hypothetical protein AMS68_000208 [Peltaster fructicola]
MAAVPDIIAWDYQFAPNAQKSRNYLYATKTPFKICEQPFVIPRPVLQNLGITYRRVPVLSIGKDVFPDNSTFIDALQSLLEKSGKGLVKSREDKAFEQWGYRTFWVALPCVPASLITPQLAKDRENLFPVFARGDFPALRANGLTEIMSMLDCAENEFLTDDGPFIGGKQECGLADIHAIWIVKWLLQTLEVAKEPGFSKKDLPRVYQWIEALPRQNEAESKEMHLTADEATKQLLAAEYAMPDIGVDPADPLGLSQGERVAVEMGDAKPGTHPQIGKLVGLNRTRIVIELKNGVRMHFPKIGYFVRKADAATNGDS